mmetsp:Transcript_33261/g.76667  ORF Transcript_33261/g.76667 Transcript_33261/m.76667 type:complete len:137 (+) Transcript_33261:278-688(+)
MNRRTDNDIRISKCSCCCSRRRLWKGQTSSPTRTSHLAELRADFLSEHRKITLLAIAHILRGSKSRKFEEIPVHDLVLVAKRVELSLYRQARTFEEYIDDKTLRDRMQVLALERIFYKKLKEKANKARQRGAHILG